jgi:hypothetical protein
MNIRRWLPTLCLTLVASPAFAEPKGGWTVNKQEKTCPTNTAENSAVFPIYAVTSVVYAPPGCGTAATPCGKPSSVDYQTQSKAGTIISISKQLKALGALGVDVKASAGIGLVSVSTEGSITFTGTKTTTDSDKEEVYKSSNTELNVPGPPLDGIDHDHDAIYLLTNPVVNGTRTRFSEYQCTPSPFTCDCPEKDRKIVKTSKTEINWSLDAVNGKADIMYVYVGWLKKPSTMPADIKTRLEGIGITPKHYQTLLERDPFASSSATTVIAKHPDRFQELNTTFPYEPPLTANDSPQASSLTLINETISTKTTEADDSSEVDTKLSVNASGGFLATASVTVTGEATWTWTNTSSKGELADQTQQAQVTITEPSFGYNGSTDMAVYWDRIYNTFVFVPIKEATAFDEVVHGTVLDAHKHPAKFTEVTLRLGDGKLRRTFTNGRGQYRLYGPTTGAASVEVGSAKKPVTLTKKPALLDLAL